MKPYYEHNGITIYHGDCREILPSLPKVDLVLTDPPYGLGKKLSGGTWGNGDISWDSVAPSMDLVLEKGIGSIIWGGNYFKLPLSRCWLVWRKPDAVPSMADIDLAWTSFDQPSRFISHSIAATNSERNGHPTIKPLKVILWSMSIVPFKFETVLDPFMGSGTTLRAAKDLGRKAIGIERVEKYCEIAAKRLSQEVFDFK